MDGDVGEIENRELRPPGCLVFIMMIADQFGRDARHVLAGWIGTFDQLESYFHRN